MGAIIPLPPQVNNNGLSLRSGPNGAVWAGGGNQFKLVGRTATSTEAYANSSGNTDIGSTGRKIYKSIGPISCLKLLCGCSSTVTGGSYAAAEGDGLWPQIVRATVEYPLGGAVHRVTVNGQTTWTVSNQAAMFETDSIGVAIPAGTNFAVRYYLRSPVPPTSPAAAAITTTVGLLASNTYYYKITAIDTGLESGPTAEISATVNGTTTTGIALTWTANPFASGYNIYRSTATGTETLLVTLSSQASGYNDLGTAVSSSSATPPAIQKYQYNSLIDLINNTGDSTNQVNSGGTGGDATGSTGALSITGGNSNLTMPYGVIADDISAAPILAIGTSITAGQGFGTTSKQIQVYQNWFDAAITTGLHHSVNTGISASEANGILVSQVTGAARNRMKWLDYVSYLVNDMGVNDLGNNNNWITTATIILNLNKLATMKGIRVIQTTIMPYVTTTDSCLTVANQTPVSIETQRQLFNTWLRNGYQVDGSGTPVQTGGTSSPYIYAMLDNAAAVEVNASNVLTLNGGYWQVPASSFITATLTGTPTTTSLVASGASFPLTIASSVVKITSGAANGQTATISSATPNTATALTLYANGSTAQDGVALSGLTVAPSAGDTIAIYKSPTAGGLHPSYWMHAQIASAAKTFIDAVCVPF